jgi:hypothetical protein
MNGAFRHALTDTDLNINAESFYADRDALTPRCPAPWWICKYRLRGGRQEGVDIVELHNGRLAIRLVPTRGMSILDVVMDDLRLGWDSPVKEVVHPMFIDPHSRGGLGWLEGFNEYLVRCGLEWFGPPCQDAHHHARGEAPAANLTLHGKIAHIPASRVGFEMEIAPPYRLCVRGLVRERMLFGPKLDLETELITAAGSDTFTLTDRITNHSAGAEEFGLLYHINHGRPLLESGSTLLAPAARVMPMTQRATEGGVENYARYSGPKHGYTEQNYMLDLLTDRRGRTGVMLRNRSATRAVSLAWSKQQLPCFTIWKNTQHEKDGYVTGLEPGTNYPYPRPDERQAGRVPLLRSGQTFTATLDITLHGSKAQVAHAARALTAIQGRRPTKYDPSPPAAR